MSYVSSHMTTLLAPGESQNFQSQHPLRLHRQVFVPRSPCHLLPSLRWRKEERALGQSKSGRHRRVGGSRAGRWLRPAPASRVTPSPDALLLFLVPLAHTLSCVKAECALVLPTHKDTRPTEASLPQWESYSHFSLLVFPKNTPIQES